MCCEDVVLIQNEDLKTAKLAYVIYLPASFVHSHSISFISCPNMPLSFASLQVTRRSERSVSHNSLSERTNQKRSTPQTGLGDLILSSLPIVYVARALGGSFEAPETFVARSQPRSC